MKSLLLFKAVFALVLLTSVEADLSFTDHSAKENTQISLLSEKLPKPEITSLKNNAEINSSFAIEGTGIPGNLIEIHVEARYKGGKEEFGTTSVIVDEDGKWMLEDFNVWLPSDVKKAKFFISAVQLDKKGIRSKEQKIKVFPTEEFRTIGADYIPMDKKEPDMRVRGEVIVKNPWDGYPHDDFPIPVILSPRDRSIMNIKKDIRFVGTGVPGSAIEILVDLRYMSEGEYAFQSYKLNSTVGEDGIWVTEAMDSNFFPKPEKVSYDVRVYQISKDGVKSYPAWLIVNQGK